MRTIRAHAWANRDRVSWCLYFLRRKFQKPLRAAIPGNSLHSVALLGCVVNHNDCAEITDSWLAKSISTLLSRDADNPNDIVDSELGHGVSNGSAIHRPGARNDALAAAAPPRSSRPVRCQVLSSLSGSSGMAGCGAPPGGWPTTPATQPHIPQGRPASRLNPGSSTPPKLFWPLPCRT
jgi:hypothetical protein